ncbi:tetratricopeptide repeat protein [Nocardiopsis sp. HUAS JQ3]|uniref:tetratricopeptide repeat protein n=1 Tax=Nocardiopsis sp. HUAS JQ3 TaxID=3061629 RepID=UPI0023A9990A|nr:tetratricopeptide/SEL1-like repeat protein [Nocardiopsis sp. HUAS JQ3]WDZ92854.1 tetratricopeptide/SEL1-like repeat protein [Nocardiopsis sp. HUAS JQ3]
MDNRSTGAIHGTALQAGAIHGPVTVNSLPAPAASPVPGWVQVALPAHQADAYELGAHDALPGPASEGLPPYVHRDVDDELDRRLAAAAASPRGGLVLVTGPSTAGKTRALAAALARTLPDRMLVAPPEGTDLRPLPAWLKEQATQAPQGWVVWLDDLDRHLGTSELTPALVTELGHADAVVAATIRSKRFKDLRPTSTEHAHAVEGAGYSVLKTTPVIVERRWSTPERERARDSGDERLVRAADDERFGVAEQLAAGPRLQQEWLEGLDNGHPRGYALVAAAVNLAAAGVSSPLTREQIHTAHTTYLPAPPPLPEEANQAWLWAIQQRSGLAGLLVPTDHQGSQWRAFDYLAPQGPLPEAAWRAALDAATDQDRHDVGLTAYRAGRADIAEAAFLPLAEQGDTGAMSNLGNLLREEGRIEEAESWYRQAADQGLVSAMFNLGLLLREVGRVEEAESWYRQAADQGLVSAMSSFGLLLRDSDRLGEAETWWCRAAEQGDTGAMSNLGNLLMEVGRLEEAESWYRQAIDRDHTDAMSNLGSLLMEVGRVEEAESWYRQAIDRDHIYAMFNLGNLLANVGRVEEAEAWYRQAADQGLVSAMFNLGIWLIRAGQVDGAESWFRRAAEQGHTNAMSNLGFLLMEVGRVEEAEKWWRRAAEQGHTHAMFNLGNLLANVGRVEEAETWRRRAQEMGGAE